MTNAARIRLRTHAERLAICRLDADAPMPPWVRGAFVSVTRTLAELSIVCEEEHVPEDVRASGPYRALEVVGPIPLDVVGVMAGLSGTLARADISLFPIATYDTDYLLVQEAVLEPAIAALETAGYEIES